MIPPCILVDFSSVSSITENARIVKREYFPDGGFFVLRSVACDFAGSTFASLFSCVGKKLLTVSIKCGRIYLRHNQIVTRLRHTSGVSAHFLIKMCAPFSCTMPFRTRAGYELIVSQQAEQCIFCARLRLRTFCFAGRGERRTRIDPTVSENVAEWANNKTSKEKQK